MRPSLLRLSLITALTHTILTAQDPGGITVEQTMDLRTVLAPQTGEGFLAYSIVTPRPLADGAGSARYHIAVIDGLPGALTESPEPRMLVEGDETAPAMQARPGTRELSFLRRIDGKMQLFAGSIDQWEPKAVAETASVASYAWRPDGGAFAFVSVDAPSPARAAAREAGFKQVVVDEDWQHRSLWMCEVGGEPKKLTSDVSVFEFEWSPDGKQIACAVAPRNLVDDSYMFKRLHVLDVATGAMRKVVDNPGKLAGFAWSSNSSSLAYISAEDPNDPHAGMLFLLDAATGEVTPVTRGLAGMIQHVQTTEEGFLLTESIGVRTRLRHVSSTGRDQWLYESRPQQLVVTGATYCGDHLVFSASTPQHPAELYLWKRGEEDKTATRLTDTNPWLASVPLAKQDVVRIRARDGLPIEGVLILPLDYEEGTRYPMVIVVHGGPEAHNSNGWMTSYSMWGQLLAARGYVSWYPNYRASTGYGVQFCKKDHGDPMGREFEDHLDAIDHFDEVGLIDPSHVGIGGGSYGGYTAAWAATRHTERFAAAVSFVPFVDIRTKWMTSDIPWEFYYVHYQEKWPWQQPGLLTDRSPLTWATNCNTPLLLLGGTSDPRVHPSQPFMLYRAVKFGTTTPTRYIQYPGEGHGNRTNVYRYDYALRTLRWFDHYLKGDGDRRDAPMPPIDVDYSLTNTKEPK
jgi:dipeptidyl aminopeptidase/acylaminoacyl peptidase